MEWFLFGGPINVGKTEAVARLAHYLIGNGFPPNAQGGVPPLQHPPQQQQDFCAVLNGINTQKKKIRIIINSPADCQLHIDALEKCINNNQPCDIVISAIRCDGYQIRTDFLQRFNISTFLELPMGSISGKLSNPDVSRHWYRDGIDEIAHRLLSYGPFYL